MSTDNFRQALESKLGNAGSVNEDQQHCLDFQLREFTEDFILNDIQNVPKLYRYSPADYDNIYGLESQTLYLAPIGSLNDIFEGLAGPIMPMEKKRLRGSNMGDAAFVKSFSENKNDLLMWGLYADSYKGMCVEYDIAKLPEPQNQKCLRHLFPVIYSDKRNQKLESYEMQRDTRNLKIAEAEENAVYSSEYFWLEDIMSLYLQKPKQWEAEKEWRIVVTYLQKLLDKDNVDPETSCPELYEINEQTIEFPCATRIFLGPRMPKHKVEHLRKIGDKIGAQVCKMVLSDDQYELKEERL